MNERPIIFSAHMVRAILDGRKTQTRRIIKNPDYFGCTTGDCPHEHQKDCDAEMRECCPKGKVGDRLWVRETYKLFFWTPLGLKNRDPVLYEDSPDLDLCPDAWCSPIFMPRWASRLTLEITDIRAECLRDINVEDAQAEGVPTGGFASPLREYEMLWTAINGAKSWAANPWVWVISFSKVQQ